MDAAGDEAEYRAVQEQEPLVLSHARSQQLGEVGIGELTHSLADQAPDRGALATVELWVGQWGHGVVDGLRGDRLADGVVLARAHRDLERQARGTGSSIDGGLHRLLDHLARPVGARAVQELLSDVPEGDDVVGDYLAIDLGYLGLAPDEQAVQLQGADPARLNGLEDHPERDPVRDPADDHAADRQDPPVREGVSEEDERHPEQRPEEEPEVDDEPELLAPDLEVDAIRHLRVLLDVADHHQLDVEQLVDVVADLVGDGPDDVRELLLDPGMDGVPDPLRGVRPGVRVLPGHDPVDDLDDVVAGRLADVLSDRLGLELVVEVGRAAELGDALVDGDRPHLRRARGDDPLPADAALHEAGDLLDPAGKERCEPAQAGYAPAGELDGVEEHPDPGPVRQVADRAGEERDRQILEK